MPEETVLDAATRLKGSIKSEDDLRVLGVVEGEVRTGGNVLVEKGGLIRGPLVAKDVLIHGAVEGNVQAAGQFCLGPTGKVVGDVRAAHIKVEDGGVLQGKVHMEGPKPFKSRERD